MFVYFAKNITIIIFKFVIFIKSIIISFIIAIYVINGNVLQIFLLVDF